MMAGANWLDGEGNVGPERICPERHILQSEWQPDWNIVFVGPKYDYISDYECIFPHPITLSELKKKDRDLWSDLQTAKEQGYGIAIENMAHFTNAEAADEIVDSGGFKGRLKKINENENGDPVRKRFSWWSPIFLNNDNDSTNMVQREQRKRLSDVLSPFCPQDRVDDIEVIAAQFASSKAFIPNPIRYGNVYFKCTIEELCDFYEAFIQNDLQFRVLGTFLYKQQIMHAVLVCGTENGNGLFANYPLIPNEGNVVTRSDDGNWTWYPQATGTEIVRLDRYHQNYPMYRRWEHVAFAFHMPQDSIMPVDNVLGRRNELPVH